MEQNNSLVDAILQRANIVDVIASYITVTKKGRNYAALCPFHDDRNPSLMISPDKKIYKCFVCGAGGNAITFVRDYEKISFPAAVDKTARLVGITDARLNQYRIEKPKDLKLEPLFACLNDLTKYYEYCLETEEGKVAKSYLEQRQITLSIQKTYRIGYALKDGAATIAFLQQKGHSLKTIERIGILGGSLDGPSDRNYGRLMFPITNRDGQVVGYSARRLNDQSDSPKYVNSPETELFHKSEILYNLDKAAESARHDGYIYVLEGFMDVFALVEAGVKSTIAIMGTAFNQDHIKSLRSLNCELRLCLDGDDAGQHAMMKMATALNKAQIKYRVVNNDGDTRDPDEIFKAAGPEGLKTYLNKLLTGIEFALNYYTNHSNLTSLTERQKLVDQMVPIISASESDLALESYLKRLAHLTGFTYNSLRDVVSKYRDKKAKNPNITVSDIHPERPVLRRLQLAEREILAQMMRTKDAFDFYQAEIGYFYHDIFRSIANFLSDYYAHHTQIDVAELIASLDASSLPEKDAMNKEITTLSFEKVPPFSLEYLRECQKLIISEKAQMAVEEELRKQLIGKSEAERAKILADHYQTLKKTTKKG